MITDMASNFNNQAESTRTSSGRRTDQSSGVNLLKSKNDNMSSSEHAVTRGNISEYMDKRLISSKFTDTVSDGKAALKRVEHSLNFNSYCKSSSIKFQLKENISGITGQMLTDEGRNNDNQMTHSEFGAEDVQTLKGNDSNIKRSWSAEISIQDNESNGIQKISNNNNKENHASNITENIKNSEEFLHLPVEPTQQKVTDILEMPCKIAKVMSDEGRSNDIQETDTGCNSGYVEALTRSENKIKMSWNTEINTDKNKINSIQKCSNNIKENHACNSTETINSTDNFLNLPAESAQQRKTNILEELPKAVRSWLHSSNEQNFMAHKMIPPEESLQCSDFFEIIMDPTVSSPPKRMSSLSASNENTGSLTEVETPATSTSNGTFKCRLIMNSVDNNFNAAHMPATTLARNSNEEQCEPINLEKKTQKISKYCSATLCGLSPPLSSTDIFPTWASGGLHTPEYTEDSDINAVNSIQTDHTKCAERNLVRICGRSRGRKTLGTCTVTVNTRNKTKCGTQMALYSKRYLADAMGHRYGNSGRGKGNSTRCSELVDAVSHRDGNSRRGRSSSTRGSRIVDAMSHRDDNRRRGRRSSTRGSELVDAMSHGDGNSRRGRSNSTRCSELVDAASHRDGNSRRGRSSSTRGSRIVDAMSHRSDNRRRGRRSSTRGSELVDAMSHGDGNSRRGRSNSTRGSELVDAMSDRDSNSRRGRSSSIRGCKFCRSNITHPSVAKQSEDTKRKHTKLTVIRNNQKNDGRIKKTCPRRTKGQGLSNNNKSLSTLGSLDTDQLRFQEYLFTGNAEQISHHIMKKRFINRFLITSNQELVRKRGMQTSTLKERIETVTSASPCVPETNNIQRNYELINNGQQQWPSGRKSSLITIDCSSPDTTSTENSTAAASSRFQNNKQQMKRWSEYSAPLATEYQQNFIPVSDNIYNPYTPYYPHEPTSWILYKDQYFPSDQNNEEKQHTARYENIITVGCSSPNTVSTENSTAVATSSFQNNKQQMKRLSEYSAPLATEYQQNFIPVSDNIHNICTPYYPQEASGIPYNDNYFPSHQNNEGEQCTDKYENTSMWGEIIKFNRGQEFPLDEVRRHADQQNEYHEENTIQNGYQNLANEIEANHYAYQLQCKTSKLNNEDLQQVETYHHTDTFRCTYDCCRSNQPMSTQNSAICQQSSEILKLDEIQNYELPSPQINSFAGVRQSTVAINENIHNQQIINNLECANVLPDTEIFQGVHWQKLDSCSGHKTAAMQGKHVNNEESIAHNWERHRTSSYSGLPYDYRIHLPTDSNSLSKPEGKFPQPSSQSIENFRLKEVVHLSDDRKVMQKGSKKKCAKNQRRRREPKGKSKPDKSYVCLTCGKREQYNVLLKRHMELHHGNSSIQK